MTPTQLAKLHARSITVPRPWTADEFTGLLDTQGAFVLGDTTGFALGRVVASEAELLTLVVAPEARRQGHGLALLRAFEAEATRRAAAKAVLEVATDNTAARALYTACGYHVVGTRPAYYHTPLGRIDALVMTRDLVQD